MIEEKWLIVGNSTFAKLLRDLMLDENVVNSDSFIGYLSLDPNSEDLVSSLELADGSGVSKRTGEEVNELLLRSGRINVISTIGYTQMNEARERSINILCSVYCNMRKVNFISKDAYVAKNALIGDGCIIMPKSIIEPEVFIGDGTVLWYGVHIAHHSVISKYCWIAAGSIVGSSCELGSGCFLGLGSIVPSNAVLGSQVLIAAGAKSPKFMGDKEVALRSAEIPSAKNATMNSIELVRFM